MNKKAAIELSMNFMVIIILSIVILSMGIYFAVRSLGQAQAMVAHIDKQTEQQIWDLLDSGQPVVAPMPSAETMRAKTAIFWIGVRNIEYTTNFQVIVDKNVLTDDCDSNKLTVLLPNTKTEPKFIKENEKDTFGVAIAVPRAAKPCEYVFNVQIFRCPEDTPDCVSPRTEYGSLQKLYVVVP
jgi:hypothetical protein